MNQAKALLDGYLFYFYVPIDHKEKVKEAVFKASGGKFNNYDSCSFEYEGTGQFRAINGANPYIGKVGELERVQEVKVEIFVNVSDAKNCKKALLDSHPYEEVAFGFLPIYHIE